MSGEQLARDLQGFKMSATETTTTATETRRFETRVCGRCWGTGRFGPLCVKGGVCFGCNGAKRVLTRRGSAAVTFYRKLCTVTAAELKPGDKIRSIGVTLGGDTYGEVRTVKEARKAASPRPWKSVTTTNGVTTAVEGVNDFEVVTGGIGCDCVHSCTPETSFVRVPPVGPERASKLAAAYDYQDTLTQAGTVRKRAGK